MIHTRRGIVLILALGLIAGLMGIVAVVVSTQREGFRYRLEMIERREAQATAFAALESALAPIDLAGDPAESSLQTNAVSTGDLWFNFGEQGSQSIRLGAGTYRIQIVDAGSLVNVNNATQAQLERLPLTLEQVESLLDYREAGRDPRANGGKDEYYNNLERPYNAKLRRFETLDELLLVRGFTYAALYEPNENVASTGEQVISPDGQPVVLAEFLTAQSFSPNTNAQGQARINVNAQATTAQRLQQAPVSLPQPLAVQVAARKNWANLGEILQLPGAEASNVRTSILENLTTSGATRLEGAINLNTASETVLSSLPDLTPDAVQAIIQRQNQGFATRGDLASLPGVNANTLGAIADRVTVSSNAFKVRVLAQSGTARFAIEADVQVIEDLPRLIMWRELDPDVALRLWRWDAEPTFETVLAEENR